MLLLSHFTKTCSKCKEIKTFSEFSNKKAGKYKVSSICRVCDNLYYIVNKDKIKDYNNARSEIIAEYNKVYRSTNQEKFKNYRSTNQEKSKNYRSTNQEKSKNYYKSKSNGLKDYYKANKNQIIQKIKIYQQTIIGKAVLKNKCHKRRSILKQGDITTIQLLELQQNAKVCYWCNCSLKKAKVHIDHYFPLSKGGLHTLNNLVVSCGTCNMKKNAKDPHIFANSIGKLL